MLVLRTKYCPHTEGGFKIARCRIQPLVSCACLSVGVCEEVQEDLLQEKKTKTRGRRSTRPPHSTSSSFMHSHSHHHNLLPLKGIKNIKAPNLIISSSSLGIAPFSSSHKPKKGAASHRSIRKLRPPPFIINSCLHYQMPNSHSHKHTHTQTKHQNNRSL